MKIKEKLCQLAVYIFKNNSPFTIDLTETCDNDDVVVHLIAINNSQLCLI